MALLKNKTESVKLISKVQSGQDGFGVPIYSETEVVVPGVLVETLDSGDITKDTDLTGKTIAYNLHIPKGDTNVWEYTEVFVRGRKCKTVGLVKEWQNPPLDWNKTIRAEAYE